ERREGTGRDRNSPPASERARPANPFEKSRLRELFHPQPVLRQKSSVMQADAVAQQLLEFLAVGRIEARLEQSLTDLLFLVLAGEVDAHQILRLFRASPLREVHQVDRGAMSFQQLFDGFVQRRLAVLEVERNRPLGAS